MLKQKHINCDLCVIGGGMAGICAAISAAREGISVVLMHERAVLGGNASSEIRMWICGAQGKNNKETGIIEEIMLENMYRNPTKSFAVWDTVLYDFIKRESNIRLLLNCTCMDAETQEGEFRFGRDRKIKSVKGYQMTTQCFYTVEAKYYADCSGDSILAPLSDAEFKIGREAKGEYLEDTEVETADNMTMGNSCLIQGRETDEKVDFIPPEWSKKVTKDDVANRYKGLRHNSENFWYLELGGDKNTIDDAEDVQAELISLSVGMWDYVKNQSDEDATNWDLDFIGLLPAKRESRRMCGEYTVTQRDISDGKVFSDEVAYGGWPVDDHYPGGFYHKGEPNKVFKTPSPYSLPFRSLYSKNVENLFFAGRNISMTHMAMSSIRVMATCALLGEAVGKAAAIAAKNSITPHTVYLEKIGDLQQLLLNEDCFLPNICREISSACRTAELVGADDNIRNGKDRAHIIYGDESDAAYNKINVGSKVEYRFKGQKVNSIHLVFDSDLNRETLEGTVIDRNNATRANLRKGMPTYTMPKTLCKAFKLYGMLNGETVEILNVENNRKRSYHISIEKDLDSLILVPTDTWGSNTINLISFDFN